jgi:hypothetical protein
MLTWMPLGLALLAILALPGTVTQADEPAPEPTGYWEVGVEYVNWYPGSGDLHRTDDDALWLYRILGWSGWTKRFRYGNRWAWEEDWKRRSRGGTEHRYVDTVDLAYFSGHGGRHWDWTYWRYLYGPVFGNGGRDHDDPYLVPGDARRAYGDSDLEWVVFSACQTLNDTSRRYWAAAMDGLHLILGFKTNMYDVVQGYHFGWRIRWNWRLLQAWFAATDITHPQRSVTARVLAEDHCHFWDRTSWVCADSPDNQYWWWDHVAGSEQALMVHPEQLDHTLPILNVVASTPSEQDLDQLASTFGFSSDVPAVLDEETKLYRVTEGGLDLTVDQQGMYYFADLDELWVVPTNTSSIAPVLPSHDTREIADTFLTTNELMPGDAAFFEVVTDSLTSAEITEVPSATVAALGITETFTDIQETISSTVATNQQVIYSRHLVYTPSGSEPITFSVQGPGARLKVYVSNEGEVIGAMGGWRTVDNVGVLDTVEILTPTQMRSLYNQLGDMVNLTPTPFRADTVNVTRSTVGYYEQPMGTAQSSLIPVYILDIEMLDTENGGSLESTAFIPAAPEMLPPLADITSISGQEPQVEPGQIITLTAADASQPLSTLGYGDNLDFSLGEGPYTYTWKLETTGKVIGTGRSITYPAGIVDDLGVYKDNDVPMVIVLEVTDGAGRTSSTTQPFTFIEMTPEVQRVYLPNTFRTR